MLLQTLMIFCFYLAAFSMLFIAIFDILLKERRSGSKGVEMMTGLPILVYWATTSVVDYIFYFYMAIHIPMIFYLWDAIAGTAVSNKMEDLYDVLFMYGIAQYYFVAALSQVVAKHYMPDTWIIVLTINVLCASMYLFIIKHRPSFI